MAENVCIHSRRVDEFFEKELAGINAPFSAGFELTAKCNLNCVHCYAKPGRNHKDLTTDAFKDLFDIMVDRGLLDAYFTGGEIFVRPDFDELYLYLRQKGVFISLLSNITLLDEHHIEMFREYPAESISTTMYGYTEQTYERITGVKGSYKKFMNSLELLIDSGLPMELKYVAMEGNREEVHQVRALGNKLGVPMVISFAVHPMNDGSMDPVDKRLTPQEAFDFDISDERRCEFWKNVAYELHTGKIDLISPRTSERFAQGYLYPCSAGDQHVFITSDGKMQACVNASYNQFDLRKGTFDEGWKHIEREFVHKKASADYKCFNCENIRFCEQCVANFKMTNGDEEAVDPFFCDVAALRRQFVDTEIQKLKSLD